MNILVENLGSEVVVALTGSADSLQYDNQSSVAVLQRLGEQATRQRPDRIWIDFQGLTYIDSAAFHQIADQLSRLRKKHPQVELVGPGPALERLFSLIDPPRWWTWSRPREIPAAAKKPRADTPRRRSTDPKGPPAGGSRESAADAARGEADSLESPAPEDHRDPPVESPAGKEASPAPQRVSAAEPSTPWSAPRIQGGAAAGEDELPDDLEEPAAETDVFEIDLDRELLLLESEPPGEEFNPMADPVDLTGSWKTQAGRRHSGEPSGGTMEPLDPGPEESPPDFAQGESDQDPPLAVEEAGDEARDDTGEDAGEEELLLLDAEELPRRFYTDEATERSADGDLDLLEEAAGEEDFAPPPPASPEESGGWGAAHRVARASDEALAARIRELEMERLILHRMLAEGRSQPPVPVRPVGPVHRRPGPAATVPGRAAATRPGTSASDSPPTRSASRVSGHPPEGRPSAQGVAADHIPAYLRGDVARSRIIRMVASAIDFRRRGRPLSPAVLRQIASKLASAALRAPFASFDLRQARARLPLGARLVHTTGMALCVAARGGARPPRLGALALTSLVWGLLAGHRDALAELSGGEIAAVRLARNLHLKVLQILGPGHGIPEDQVRQDLRLLSLAREFWRRLGGGSAGGPAGGAEPAVAMAALARGEIGRSAPAGLRRAFVETFSIFPPGSWVRLESGEVAVVVAPGTVDSAGPVVLCLFAGGERELRLRPPRLVDTGRDGGSRIQAVVRPPLPRCALPRDVLRVREGLSMK